MLLLLHVVEFPCALLGVVLSPHKFDMIGNTQGLCTCCGRFFKLSTGGVPRRAIDFSFLEGGGWGDWAGAVAKQLIRQRGMGTHALP